MKKLWFIFFLAITWLYPKSLERKCTLEIEGMSCQSCAKAIEKSLLELKGVQKVAVDFKTGKGEIYFEPNQITEDKEIQAAVSKAGYQVKKITWSK